MHRGQRGPHIGFGRWAHMTSHESTLHHAAKSETSTALAAAVTSGQPAQSDHVAVSRCTCFTTAGPSGSSTEHGVGTAATPRNPRPRAGDGAWHQGQKPHSLP
eukprot:2573997-Prymnesium_polylepis.1